MQEIKDDVDYYVDNNDDSNLPENLDSLDIFEDLDLDKYDSAGSTCKIKIRFFYFCILVKDLAISLGHSSPHSDKI